jgi:hypothetical protein
MRKKNLQITLSALFLAMGLLFPILFHGLGLSHIFLPMFWPAAAAAFFLTVPQLLLLSIATPLLSALLTGMPPLAPPIAQVMAAELLALTLTIALLHRYTLLGDFWVMLCAFLASRSVLAFTALAAAPLLGWPGQLFSLAMVATGLPGIAVMLIVIPSLIARLKKERLFGTRSSHATPASHLL